MKIAHFSDPHAGMKCPDWTAWFDKRWVGLFNYRFRRCFQHDLEELKYAVEYILDNKFDVAVCTGDLTTTGQKHEFELVKSYLKPLRDSNIPIIYTPGNHDCYVKRKSCVEAVNAMVEYLSKGEYKFSDMPFVKRYCDVDFIVLNCSYPSNLLCSWGFLKKKDSRIIEEICSGEKQVPRILVNHYPIIEDHPILRLRHSLLGQKKVKELLLNGAIDLSLCGHVHKQYSKCDDSGRGEYCSGSVTKNGIMTEINYDETKKNFEFKIVNLKKEGNLLCQF